MIKALFRMFKTTYLPHISVTRIEQYKPIKIYRITRKKKENNTTISIISSRKFDIYGYPVYDDKIGNVNRKQVYR